MHLIIVGAKEIGRYILELATRDGHDIFVVEKNKERAEDISKNYDCKVVNADATSKDALKQAGAEEADALISTTNDDAVNLLILNIAREFEIDTLISSVAEEHHLNLFKKMGVGTVESPSKLNAQHLYRSVKNPNITDFLDLGGGISIVEFEVKDKSKVKGKTIGELEKIQKVDQNTRIVVIRRGDDMIVPKHSTTLKTGDMVALLAKENTEKEINELFDDED